jgi:hypothetical protein
LCDKHLSKKKEHSALDQLKATRKVLAEMNESYIDLIKTTKATGQSVHAAQQLWRSGHKSRLIKIGVALIVFPDPSPTTEIIGGCLVAAGAVKSAVRKRSMFMEDVKKTFQDSMKEISATKQNL